MARERTKPKPDLGKFSDEREAWLRVDNMDLFHFVDETKTPGYRRSLRIRRPRGGALSIALDWMTEQELRMFKEFIVRACDLAVEDAIKADGEARRQLEEHGDDTVLRNYRQEPRVYYRIPGITTRKGDRDAEAAQPDNDK